MLFLPILGYFVLLLIFLSASLVAFIVSDRQDSDNFLLVAIEGFLQVKLQFYLIFLTPLRIADKYRFTQEVTPAGTIFAVNVVVCS